MMTLEDFLAKVGATERLLTRGRMLNFDSPLSNVNVNEDMTTRGKRGPILDPLQDKAAQQRQRRMNKNRESAARFKERKQAYQDELKSLAFKLEEENVDESKNTVKDHIMDSGALFHATYCKEELERFKQCPDKTLKDVRYITGLKRRLISGSLMRKVTTQASKTSSERIGMNMLASKGNVPNVQKVDIYFCKPGGLGKQKKLSFIMSEKTKKLQRIRRDTRLSKAEILDLWTRFMRPLNDGIVTEHGLISEITLSSDGRLDTSEGFENSRRFEDSGRSNKEYSKDRESFKEEGFETPHWKKVINKEMVSLEKNQTCSLFKISTGKKTSQRLWMFKVKEELDGRKRQVQFRRTSLTGFPAQSIRSFNAIALDSPYLLVLITGTSQSRQHGKSESDSYYLSD
nr:G-box-binding factor 4 [Tanacetum cinerariifolium]